VQQAHGSVSNRRREGGKERKLGNEKDHIEGCDEYDEVMAAWGYATKAEPVSDGSNYTKFPTRHK
jgi:hypothetical protein